MYQQNNSPPRHIEANYNIQTSTPPFSSQTPELNYQGQRPQANFSLQGPQGNLTMQPPQGNLSMQGPDYNYGRQGNQINVNLNGPSFNRPQDNQEISERIPFSSPEIKAYIKKKPYTQTVGGQQITYSILAKKQQTFVMTNDRFLLLIGSDLIGYARQFPEKAELPFRTLEEVPAPKVAKPIVEVQKCNVNGTKLLITFSGKNQLTWQFQCPSKSCAIKWSRKIEEAMMAGGGGGRETGRFNYEVDNQKRTQNISHINNYLNTDTNVTPNFNANINTGETSNQRHNVDVNMGGSRNMAFNSNLDGGHRVDPNRSVFETRVNQSSPPRLGNVDINANNNIHLKSSTVNHETGGNVNFGVNANFGDGITRENNTDMMYSNSYSIGTRPNQNIKIEDNNKYFSGANMSKVEDFISSRRLERSGFEPQLLRSKSVGQINIAEKESIRRELSKMKRNWIQQLLGGQEEVELIIDFKSYIQRLAAVIVTELYVSQNQKIFPATQIAKDFASFVFDDVYIELYFFHEGIEDKHPRFLQASLEFKNMDYLLSVTKNEGTLKVPFMMLFEYKGFLGMAKTRLPQNSPSRNRQCYNHLNVKEFEQTSRISAETLLNENTCKIVSYYRQTPISTTSFSNGNVYFVEKLMELLPMEIQSQNTQTKVLRPQLLRDRVFDATIFRNKHRPVKMDGIAQIIDHKINQLIKFIQNEEEYFTNSRQLEEMIHLSGLNMRHLGVMLQRVRLNWFRQVIQAEIIARCLKNLYRRDMQNCVMIQSERNKSRQRQDDYERRRVISFFNVVFGNTKDTAEVWRRINRTAQLRFGVAVSEADITGANIPYLMQAIQTHLKISMNDSIHQKRYFQSPQTFEPMDFKRFEFDTNIYDLAFTNLFEEIEECLDFQTPESFYNLSSILIKETSNRVPVVDMLKKHPIHQRISEFLLNFTSPQQSRELYTRLEVDARPSKFLYQSKLAEIKWSLKTNRLDRLQHPAAFISDHGRKWLGEVHPMFTQVSRLIASYFSDHLQHFQLALRYAQDALEMQKKIFGGENGALWKDYFLLGKIYFTNKNVEQAMKYLSKAREMVRLQELNDFETFAELNLLLCKGHFGARRNKDAYNTAKELYTLLRNRKDQKSLSYLLESVGWMRQILEISQDQNAYYQFLQVDFSNQLKAFAEHPALLINAIRTVAVPALKNAIFRSPNSVRILNMMQELSKMTMGSQSTMSNYLREKILDGTYPRSFLLQLKDIGNIVQEILETRNIERWKAFYQNSSQSVLDTMASVQVNRNFQFMANLTALFNLFGRQVMQEVVRK